MKRTIAFLSVLLLQACVPDNYPQNHDFSSSRIDVLKSRAASGIIDAQKELAWKYYYGDDVPQNFVEAAY